MNQDRAHWIATDLDGTLFSREQTPGAVAATWRRNEAGEEIPSSWMPAARHILFEHLTASFRMVPITARDFDSYSRVRIAAVPLADGAILANGAIFLQPGSMLPDPEWDAQIAPQLAEWAEPLKAIAATLREASQGAVVPRLVASHTPFPAYLVAKSVVGYWSEPEGLRLRELLAPFKCRVAELGRELQVLPPPVGKWLGLQEFSRRYCRGAAPLLAFGDMPEDLHFMGAAEFVAAPSESTLGRIWRHGL